MKVDVFGGDVAIDNDTFSIEALSMVETLNSSSEAFFSYKNPKLGLQKDKIPTFTLFKKDRGIFIYDLVPFKVDAENFNVSEWEKANGEIVENRDLVVDSYEQEFFNRIKDESVLFSRKNKAPLMNVEKRVVLCENSDADIATIADNFCDVITFADFQGEIVDIISNAGSSGLSQEMWDRLVSVTDGSRAWEAGKKRAPSEIPDLKTKCDFINFSLAKTFKLDKIQRKAAIELPEGPQRIRGLAGTGKTVILSMKAAIAHANFPDFKVLYVFHTQSLYQIVKDHIGKYFASEARRAIDENNLHVCHSWGGRTTMPGLYYRLCTDFGFRPFTLSEALAQNPSDPVDFIYRDLLLKIKGKPPIYDFVLIDEAQDLPQVFFEVIFHITKDPKRIVWAYDEFQSLNDIRIKEPEELFGKNDSGVSNFPNTILAGEYPGGIKKDFILPVSYRNPRYNLVIAHAFGLGIYNKSGIVDVLENRYSWEAIGYKVLRPDKEQFAEGDLIELTRDEETSKNILESTLIEAARIANKTGYERTVLANESKISNAMEEIEVVAKQIKQLLDVDKIPPEQIAVISLSRYKSKSILTELRQKLDQLDIKAITPGIIESPSLYRKTGFVTLTNPRSAKGNESYVVIVMNADEIYNDLTFRKRNALFVSITRSLGWCYIFGAGQNQQLLNEEFKEISGKYPNLIFPYPSEENLRRRRMILADNDDNLAKAEKSFDDMVESNEDLLVELIKNRPDLLAKITKK